MVQFARSFFDTRDTLPRLDILLTTLVAASLVVILLTVVNLFQPVVNRTLVSLISYLTTIVTWLTLPALAIYATLRMGRGNWPLVIAWSIMMMLAVGLQFVWMGLIGQLPLGTHLYGVVAYIEALCLSIAMVLRVRDMQQQALKTEAKLSTSLAEQLAESQRLVELTQDRAMAMQDAAEKGELLLAAGHDTRQMLSSLRNYAAGLGMGEVDKDRLDEARNKLVEIADNLDEVLATAVSGSYSNSPEGTVLAFESFAIENVFKPLTLVHELSAKHKGLSFRTFARDFNVTTDRAIVMRVLSNLVSNSVRYTDTGGVLLAARRRVDHILFEVWDTGVGLNADTLNILLNEPVAIHRFSSTSSGVGAGLSLSRKLLVLLDSHLEGVSVPGIGSVFRFRIFHARSPGPTGWGLVGDNLVPEALTANFVQLESMVAASAFEGPLLLDGDRLKVEEVQKLGENSRQPVIIATYDRGGDARHMLSAAVDFILYKPLSIEQLRVVNSRIISMQRNKDQSKATEIRTD